MNVSGLVLAAGAGVRAGGPKALRREPDGRSWLSIAAAALAEAGCSPVIIVLGAAADEALPLLPDGATAVVNADWADGLSTSLKAGLAAAEHSNCDGVLITLVDLPWQSAAESLATLALVDPADPRGATARPVTDGVPGHPVYIGRDHWPALTAKLQGDQGAGAYLASLS